jgi:hypothetical protein
MVEFNNEYAGVHMQQAQNTSECMDWFYGRNVEFSDEYTRVLQRYIA